MLFLEYMNLKANPLSDCIIYYPLENQLFNYSTIQPINQSTIQPINQSTIQPINQSLN